MTELTATRTLVKSPPELWAQCSDAESLGRHLHAFGEIRITRLEPETTVAWEGERASGTVRIEPSGWGTKVTLTADPLESPPEPPEMPARPATPAPLEPPEPPAPPASEVAPVVIAAEVAVAPAPEPGEARRRGGILGWLFGRRAAERPTAERPAAERPAAVQPEPAVTHPAAVSPPSSVACPPPALDADAALGAALASLGQAHHRPFSRT